MNIILQYVVVCTSKKVCFLSISLGNKNIIDCCNYMFYIKIKKYGIFAADLIFVR